MPSNDKTTKSPVKTPVVRSTVAPPPGAAKGRTKFDAPSFSMLGIRSGLLHSTFIKVVMGMLIAIFAIGFALTSITGPGMHGPVTPRQVGSGPDPAASVGSQNIARDKFQNAFSRQVAMMSQYGMPSGPADLMHMRQSSMQTLTDAAMRQEEAQKEGITVTEEDIDKKIQSLIDDETKSARTDAAERRRVEMEFGSLDAKIQKLKESFDRDAIRRQLMEDKLEEKIKDANKVTEADYKASVTKLKLWQLTVRPKPVTPGKDKAEREKAEADAAAAAKAKAEKLIAGLKTPTVASFAALAKKESDDAMSKPKGGDLGWKMPSELPLSATVKDALQKATGSLVGPVQDDYSKELHVFYIEGRKPELPKDYATKKEQYRKDYETQRDNEVWQKFQDDLKKQYTVELYDPALQAYKMQSEPDYSAPPEQQTKARQETIDKYDEALKYASPGEAAAIHYQMAQLYREMNQPDKQIEALRAVIKDAPKDTTSQIDLARALRMQKKDKEAQATLAMLSKQLTEAPPQQSQFNTGGMDQNDQLRMQIAMEYDALGKKDLAAAERKKMKPTPTPPPGAMGGARPGHIGGGLDLGELGGGPIRVSPGGKAVGRGIGKGKGIKITPAAGSSKGRTRPTKP